MLTTIVFFLSLLLTVGIPPVGRILEDSNLSEKNQNKICSIYLICICIMWSWLFYLLH